MILRLEQMRLTEGLTVKCRDEGGLRPFPGPEV